MKTKNKNVSLEKSEILLFLARHFILSLFSVILLSVITASIIINNYYPFIPEKTLQAEQVYFDENVYNLVLKSWGEREQKIQQLDSKQYPSLFYENVKSEAK